MPPRQTRPPAPLSARPLLPRRPALLVPELASFAERAARTQPGHDIDLPAPSTRQFHMDGQTYDDAVGHLQKELQRPSSSDSGRGRIGPWTDEEDADRRDNDEVDIQKYVYIRFQPVPMSGCISPDCNSLCRHYNPTVQNHGVPEQRQQERKQNPPPRPPPPPLLHRTPPPPQQQSLSPPRQSLPRQPQLQQQAQHQRKNSQAWHPKLWVPQISSPLRQAHVSSPHQAQDPQQQQPLSPRPNSADVSPLTPPPRSPLRDAGASPEKGEVFNGPEAVPRPTAYNTRDPAIAEALCDAEKQNGEPLLEWEIETIKASKEGRTRTPKIKGPHVFVRWEKDPRANRAASESSSTALAFLLKSMSGMPSQEQTKLGIVSIGSVSQKRPQPSPAAPTTPAASLVNVTSAGRQAYYEAQARQAVVYEDGGSSSGGSKGSNGSNSDDYTTSWPESSYYFSNNSETLDEKPRRSQPTPSSRSNRSSRSSSEESSSLNRQPRVPKAAEVRQVRHASQR